MTNRSHFQPGYGTGSVFTCTCCGHRTRAAGDNYGSDLCPICYELYGLGNSLSDDGVEEFLSWDGPAERDRLVAEVAAPRLAKMRADSWLAPLFNL